MKKVKSIPLPVLTTLLLVFAYTNGYAQLRLKAGLKIKNSVKVVNDIYILQPQEDLHDGTVDMQRGIIEISGNDLVVDFNGAMLRGDGPSQMPDEYRGLAIIVKGGKNITIRNLKVRGYKVALMATGVEGLVIENCDLSYNYRQRLNSSREKEDISDWMSFHHNEKDEWLRYGAAIYLRNCNKAVLRNNIVTGGQCALMMTACNDGLVYYNNFSFNSAIGIGMYRSSRNQVVYNRLDWNVRGHSDGVYNRGQDSAAILVFEQCNENVFGNNSATHSGDGFFLWAGQTTMDTGKGGCNDNLLVGNDFSFAPTNGIEVTFSRNKMMDNIVRGCDHGIWGGYSYNSTIAFNQFSENRIAIAIEHGQEIDVTGNSFTNNRESIRLWARKEQPADWIYAREKDTRSRNYDISGNKFSGDGIVFNIVNTTSIELSGNKYSNNGQLFKLDSISKQQIDSSGKNTSAGPGKLLYNSPVRRRNVMLPPDHPKGRKEIRMTEWGPYDYRYPLLWLTNPVDTSGLMKFVVLGPKNGTYRLAGYEGVQLLQEGSTHSGSMPDSFTVQRLPGRRDVIITVNYEGPGFTDMFGTRQPATGGSTGKAYKFEYRDTRVHPDWQVKWYEWDSTTNPVTTESGWNTIIKRTPVLESSGKPLDYAWWGGLTVKGQKISRFITEATADANVKAGEYELSVTWDDAVRVYLDGRLILNEWNPSLYKFDQSPNRKIKLSLNGRHTFRVEHVELGGFATISVKLKRL